MVQLDARAMARIIGTNNNPRQEFGYYYTSSGSEHDGDQCDDESLSLSGMVECFLEESWEDEIRRSTVEDEFKPGESTQGVDSDYASDQAELLHQLLASDIRDQVRNQLITQVHWALETLQLSKKMALRGVMSQLRSLGHNAAVCKTKWGSSSGGLVSGGHEFIDVVVAVPASTSRTSTTSTTHVRYIIDLDFSSEFEIARPSESYKRLMSSLPVEAFVGREEELKKIVKVMSDAGRRSLKSRDMQVPPWRKNRYMQMKWFGPYKRTTNPFPFLGFPTAAEAANNDSGSVRGQGMCYKEVCRAVGFNPVCHRV